MLTGITSRMYADGTKKNDKVVYVSRGMTGQD